MSRSVTNRFGPVAAFGVLAVVNVLSNALPINGQTMTEISAKYPSLFTPAGYTFSIWGVIYLTLLGYMTYQMLPAQRNNATLSRVSVYFMINCIANAAWLILWHHDYLVFSLFFMLVILATLIIIYRSIEPIRADHIPLLVSVPFSLYLGWITVATIANISVLQNAYGWDDLGLSATHWTALKLAIAGTIGAAMVLRKGDILFVLVVAWAAYGISQKQLSTPWVAGAAIVLTYLSLMLASIEGARKIFHKK